MDINPCRLLWSEFKCITLADQWLPVFSCQNCVRGWTALRKTARSCRKSYAGREKPERGWNVPSRSSNNRWGSPPTRLQWTVPCLQPPVTHICPRRLSVIYAHQPAAWFLWSRFILVWCLHFGTGCQSCFYCSSTEQIYNYGPSWVSLGFMLWICWKDE